MRIQQHFSSIPDNCGFKIEVVGLIINVTHSRHVCSLLSSFSKSSFKRLHQGDLEYLKKREHKISKMIVKKGNTNFAKVKFQIVRFRNVLIGFL